jgi:anti-sigma regulatory factor (Ser/Thr protein kinase)
MRRRRSFAQSPASVSAARRFARDALRDLPPTGLEVVELMVSELATNCIRHSQSAFEVVIDRTQADVRIEVSDRAGGTPTVRSPGPEDPRGRGLKIVEMLSEDWGVDYHAGDGKTVWFVISAATPSAA